MGNFDIPSNEKNIDEVIQIPQELGKEYEMRRQRSMVGSFDQIKRKFHEMPITEGWSAYSYELKKSGAIVAVKFKMPMVNTDIITKNLAPYVLEDEAI